MKDVIPSFKSVLSTMVMVVLVLALVHVRELHKELVSAKAELAACNNDANKLQSSLRQTEDSRSELIRDCVKQPPLGEQAKEGLEAAKVNSPSNTTKAVDDLHKPPKFRLIAPSAHVGDDTINPFPSTHRAAHKPAGRAKIPPERESDFLE